MNPKSWFTGIFNYINTRDVNSATIGRHCDSLSEAGAFTLKTDCFKLLLLLP